MALLISASAIIATIATVMTNIGEISQTVQGFFPTKLAPTITYARFFGTFSTPYIINRKKPEYNRILLCDFEATQKWWEDSGFFKMGISKGPVHDQVLKTMKIFNKDPKNLSNPLYSLLFLGNANAKDYLRYLDRWLFEVSPEEIERIRATFDKEQMLEIGEQYNFCTTTLTNCSEQIGYTFLMLTNNLESSLEEINLTYDEYSMPVTVHGFLGQLHFRDSQEQ